MTNDEINRKVAELRGWKPRTTITGVGAFPITIYEPPPNYCTDPAAWGALFVALAEEGYWPALAAGDSRHIASLRSDPRTESLAATPGEALCLAFIASQER